MADRIAPTDAPSAAGEALVETLTRFGKELRDSGIPVGSGDLVTYCEAVALLDPGDLLDLYWAGRSTLVTRRDQIPIYDRVFRSFFLGGATRLPDPVRRAVERSVVPTEAVIEVPAAEPWRRGEEGEEARLGLAASDIEIWRHKSFTSCTEEELAAVRRIIHRMRMVPPRRRTRRTAPSRAGNRPDLRRTVRAAMRAHGDPSQLHWRRRTLKPRPMVLILDVSGSMADYSRNLLQFAYSARQAAKVEVFCFGTRLTRITRALERRRPDQALDEAAQVVFDWEGGTRIGHAIDTFVRRWGRRRMSRGAIVMICSDGLDRGDPALLSDAMERLARLSHRIVWVNPHRGDDPAWRPSTLGMMVAEPHIDLLLSGHDLASLEAITEQLPALR
jgi:uncharacterized protein